MSFDLQFDFILLILGERGGALLETKLYAEVESWKHRHAD